MNFRRDFLIAGTSILFAAGAFSQTITVPVTIQAADGSVTINIPSDLAPLINQNMAQIEQALKTNNINKSKIEGDSGYEGQILKVYDDYKVRFPGLKSPFEDTVGNINNFCDDLVDVIPNTQGIQNIYADAWIGKLIPGAHFGAGVNAGASSIDISAIKKTAQAMDIDTKDIPDTFGFPTISADLRIGGIFLPFDIGVAVMKFDSSKASAVEKAIDPMNFDYCVFGGDFRYAILKGGMFKPKVSIGAGYYYTNGSVGISNDQASASLNFTSESYILEAQASCKLLFLVPFVGTKMIYSKTNIDWKVDAKWNRIFDSTAPDYAEMLSVGILPSHFSGESSGSGLHPQVFGGVGFDFFIMSATVSAAYDIKSKIISGAVSARISW